MTSREDHRYYREQLGAFLLGDLDERERRDVEAHIDDCGECRTEVGELRPVIAAMAEAAPEEVEEEAPQPPPELKQRTLSRVRESSRVIRSVQAQRRRRRRLVGSAAAVAAIVVVIGLVAFLPSLLGSSGPPTEQVTFSQEPAPIDAKASLIDHSWGTETVLTGSGFKKGQTYEVALMSKDGRRVPSGTFLGTGDSQLKCDLTTSLLRENATRFTVSTTDGEQVLNADLSDTSSGA